MYAIHILFTSVFTCGTIDSQPSILTSAKAVCVSTCFTILRAVERTLVTVITLSTCFIILKKIVIIVKKNIFKKKSTHSLSNDKLIYLNDFFEFSYSHYNVFQYSHLRIHLSIRHRYDHKGYHFYVGNAYYNFFCTHFRNVQMGSLRKQKQKTNEATLQPNIN